MSTSSSGLGGRVVVLAGGLSHERDVSLRSGRRVADALRGAGVEVEERDVDSTLVPALVADRPIAVLPVLHGAAGEDGAVRDVLGALRIPYVGATPDACRIAYDKPVAKTVVRGVGIATPDAVALPHAVFRELGAAAVLDAIVGELGLPLVVKPTRGGFGTRSVGGAHARRAAGRDGVMLRVRRHRAARTPRHRHRDRGLGRRHRRRRRRTAGRRDRAGQRLLRLRRAVQRGRHRVLRAGAAARRGHRGGVEGRAARAPGARAARPVAFGPRRQRRRHGVVPRGQRSRPV